MESEQIIIDRENRQIYIQKVLTEYNIDVYQYLHEHRNVHIPYVKEFHEENGRLVVTEKFIQGRTLDELLASEDHVKKSPETATSGEKPSGRKDTYHLTDSEKKEILNGILDAVEFLHSATPPIIHRDIKPSNIMVTSDGISKLIDYDAAKIKHKEESHDTVYLGTHGSAAPEQYGFGASDERTDIYAIGVLIKELFPENRQYIRIAETAISLDPSDRYQSIKELRRAMKGYLILPFHVNIPGFRNGNIVHMLIATFVYFVTTGVIIDFNGDGITNSERIIYQIICACMAFSEIDLWTRWTPVFIRFIPIRSKNRVTRILTTLVLSVFIFIFWIVVMLIVLYIAGY